MTKSEKIQIVITGLIAVLSVPILILNFLGGIVSGVWLIILGEWGEIFRGILIMAFSAFFISFALMPGMLFSYFLIPAMEKGKKIRMVFFGSLNLIYTEAIIALWCVYIMYLFMSSANDQSFTPLLLWSYGVAMAPWMFLAYKDQQSGGNEFSVFSTFLAQIAYIVGMVMFWFGASLGAILVEFAVIMLIGAIVQLIAVFGGEVRKSIASKEVKEAFTILDEIGQKFSGAGFDEIRPVLEKYLTTHSKEYIEESRKTSVRQWVYSAVANTAGDFIESGHFHIYRGMLNPMGPGGSLLKLFDNVIDELVSMGELEAERGENEKTALRKNMEMMG